MWWCSGMRPQRGPLALAALAVALLLGGCGFHPLYGEGARQADEPLLAAIKVAPIPNRMGQQLEFALREELNPRGIETATRYRLDVILTISNVDLGIQSDATATTGRVDVFAVFNLIDIKSNKPIYSSRARTTASYNITNDAFAAQIAFDDAHTRNVRELTEEISTRLTLFLRQRHAG
jgi:LPS-assembly lipoprotein